MKKTHGYGLYVCHIPNDTLNVHVNTVMSNEDDVYFLKYGIRYKKHYTKSGNRNYWRTLFDVIILHHSYTL